MQKLRVISVLLVMCLLMGLAVSVSAADYSAYGSYDEAVEQLRQAMTEREASIPIAISSNSELPSDYYSSLFYDAVAHTGTGDEGDYLFYSMSSIDFKDMASHKENNVYYYSVTVVPKFDTTAAQEQELTARIGELLTELALSGKSDYQKICSVYDYVCENVAYDETTTGGLQYTAYNALINGKAVCQGYASLIYRLLLELGIDCRIISGTANGVNHAWNIVRLDGKYYYLDATWDAEITGEYDYFLRGTSDFSGHTLGERFTQDSFTQAYPMAETKYSVPVASELNGLVKGSDGIWYYYMDNAIAYDYVGLADNGKGTWYIKNGTIDFTYSGLYEFEGQQYYVSKGMVDTKINGLMKWNNIWHYFANGKIDTEYAGLVDNRYGTYYVSGGQIDFTYTNMVERDGQLWYVRNGMVNRDFEGLYKHNDQWVYIQNAQISTDYTGLAKNSFGWFYVRDGLIDFSFTGFAENDAGKWFVYKGQIKFDYIGLWENNGEVLYIRKGLVDTDHCGVMKYDGGYVYVGGGKIDHTYSGIGENAYGQWYVVDGIVDFSYTGTYEDPDGTVYNIYKGQVK